MVPGDKPTHPHSEALTRTLVELTDGRVRVSSSDIRSPHHRELVSTLSIRGRSCTFRTPKPVLSSHFLLTGLPSPHFSICPLFVFRHIWRKEKNVAFEVVFHVAVFTEFFNV